MLRTNPEGIPHEMKLRPQWVCFDADETGKRPFIPGTTHSAAPNRPADWRTFATAWKDVEEGRRTHVAYCFSSSDPYTFIDLDEPTDPVQKDVFKHIKTYCQTSVSGNGRHLICRGSFTGPGRHPSSPDMGIFKENRFCVMTGRCVKGRDTIEAVDERLLQSVHTFLSKGDSPAEHGEIEGENTPCEIPDMTVWQLGCDTFTRFRNLSNGKWRQYEDYGNDHSTADHAFLAMLCDLTPCNDQVRRLFQYSGMWTPERAEKKAAHGSVAGYLDRSIRKVRSKQAKDREMADKVHLRLEVDEPETEPPPIELLEKVRKLPPHGARNLIDDIPPGLIRDIAEYSFRTSYLPLQEASVSTGIMSLSMLCGRGFLTPTNSGLNLWIILVGGTSCGKDEYQSGLKRIIHAVGKNNANIRRIFGGEIVSGPGLETTFQETPRYLSYMPEFGDTFRTLANPLAAEYVKTLNRGLLNSYNSAGKSGSSEGRRKAQGSDEKTYVERPCLCLAGEATPESLFGGMTTRELSTGFLQRFIIIEVDQASWSLEENPLHAAAPPRDLVARLDRLALMMDSRDQKNSYFKVPAEDAAARLLKQYRDHKREVIMRMAEGLAEKEIVNRAGLKAIRLATNQAVAFDFDNPVILEEHALWAIRFVEERDNNLLQRFTSGRVGSGQVKQEAEIFAAITRLATTPSLRHGSGWTKKMAKSGAFPYQAVKDLVVNLPVFANDRNGAVTAFDRCMENLVKAGNRIVLLPTDMSAEMFGSGKTRVYMSV